MAFNVLALSRVFSRTLADNVQVVAFHDSFGVPRVGETTLDVDGVRRRAIVHSLNATAFAESEPRLSAMAARLARRKSESALP